ncbi:MAG: hypothetical protein AAGA68_09410 [Pseudomonadota bacterium]
MVRWSDSQVPTLALVAMVATAFGGAGCVSTTVIQTGAVAAQQAEVELPEEQLLDVGVTVFDPGLPTPEEKAKQKKNAVSISESVRNAEARYIPYVLSETLQQTNHWGAVRVIPRASNSVDLTVSGAIVHSDGERLSLSIEARDATGRLWFEKDYDHLTGQLSYRDSLPLNQSRLDPFQDLYNIIANDLAQAMEQITPEQRVAIRQVAELRFAGDLSPEAFGDFLAETDGLYKARRLPAYSDPMVARMRRIREREYLFFDTLDQHFQTFAQEMDVPYDEWRKYTYDEVITLREIQRQALAHKLIGGAAIAGGLFANTDSTAGSIAEWTAITGGIAALKVGIDKKRQSRLHAAALEELNGSFEAEVEPMVVEIEGQTVTLQGSLDSQFDEWRTILRDIYSLETGETFSTAGSGGDGAGSAASGEGTGESAPR